ncbi:MAG: pilus assembly protein PilM [Dysgonamonadaceae bacterium]|jgi:cell division protein FtsA|nr:pilus assembly protein PilM [Dysgonamonadaceae bacterium]
MHEKIVAAVDLGTSAITAMLAKKDADGRLSVIAEASTGSGGYICRGSVVDADEIARKISDLIPLLEKKQKLKIERIYIGIGGQSVRSLEIDAYLASSDDYMADDLLPAGYEILENSTPWIIAKSTLVKSPLDDVKEKINVVPAGYIISAKALAEAVLTPEEKKQACALLDFGAGKTTLAIYKNHALKYLITLPFGSSLITKDISSLKNMSEQEAENFKTTSGLAIVDDNSESKKKQLSHASDPIDPNRIVEARMDEILSNVDEQIKCSGYGKALTAGIVITGGGAALQKLPEAIRNKTGYQVRVATARDDLFMPTATVDRRLEHAQVIGLLALGDENCVEIPKVDPKPVDPKIFGDDEMGKQEPRKKPDKKKSGPFRRVWNGITDAVEGSAKDLFDQQ